MNDVIRGTTPKIRFTFRKIAISDIETAFLTIKQNNSKVIEKSLEDATIGEQYLTFPLSQEDTLKLKANTTLKIQIRWKLFDGNAGASKVYECSSYEVLKDGEI